VKVWGWLVARAVEPSTWRGLAAALAAVGLVSPGQEQALVAVALAVLAIIEIFRKEQQK